MTGLVLMGAACGTPGSPSTSSTSTSGQTLAEAQATNVRRTAVAEVQRIIANNPAPTSTPNPTAVPRPSCQNAIWWFEARSHLDELRTVQGTIIGTRAAPNGQVLVELGQAYPDPLGVAVLVPGSTPTADLPGKTVCVSGRIGGLEGRPTIQLRDAASLVVVPQ
jgi:hypothetical protein